MDTLVRRRPRRTLWSLRVLATLLLVAVLAQPVLAGLFLVGDVDAVEVHGVLGMTLAAFALALIAAALAYAVVGGRWWAVLASVALFLAIGVQIGLGFARTLQAHVPLGVALAVGAALFAAWAWTPAAGRPRGGAR